MAWQLTKAMMYRDYRAYNRLYFQNRLPKAELYFVDQRNPILKIRASKSEVLAWERSAVAETASWIPSDKTPNKHEIRFARMFRRLTGRAIFRIVLLHEMIHMRFRGCRAQHGPRFQKEKRRLILEGAFDDLL
jgi:hypothetical protein